MFETKKSRSVRANVHSKTTELRKNLARRPVLKTALALPDRPENLNWYVLKTAPQREHIAVLLLSEIGLVAFNPVEIITVRSNRRSTGGTQTRERAILPSMVLLAFLGTAVPWFEVFKLSVVTGVIYADGRPAMLGPKAVRHLLHRSGKRAVTRPHLVANDRATIVSGVFAGWEGKVVELRDHALRAIIDLDNGIAPMSIPSEMLVRISENA